MFRQQTDTAERLARLYINGLDVNAEMVCLCAAWFFRQYAKDKHLYIIEDQARKENIGLWGLSEADRMPPWE